MIVPYVAWIAFWSAVFDPRLWTDAPLSPAKREARAVRTKRTKEDSSRFHPRRVNRVLVQAASASPQHDMTGLSGCISFRNH
jgi:hypothetical protein